MTLQKMSYETIQAIADAELAKYGLDRKGWRHEFDDETCHVGSCWDSRKLITSSRHYIANGLNAEQIVDTIRHEIAHALDQGTRYSRDGKRLAHGRSWKIQCMVTGARPSAKAIMDGYINPNKETAKWTMVVMSKDKTSIEFHRSCPRFLRDMYWRNIRGRKDTRGRLWLVDTKAYNAYTKGLRKLTDLVFWQDNPNGDNWHSTPKSMKIGATK
jgi:hypothetical protein